MNTYVVWPLDPRELYLYTSVAAMLREGTIVSAGDPEGAALAVAGVPGAKNTKRFAVVEATLIDLEPLDGFETMPTDEGPHR